MTGSTRKDALSLDDDQLLVKHLDFTHRDGRRIIPSLKSARV
jgi:hypothetical protein